MYLKSKTYLGGALCGTNHPESLPKTQYIRSFPQARRERVHSPILNCPACAVSLFRTSPYEAQNPNLILFFH